MEADGGDEKLGVATKETERLKKQLREVTADRDAMKKQAENLQEEYARVGEQLNKLEVSSLR